MPRLPSVKDVTRVSNEGLRLPALEAPKTDPTGAALQELGRSLGEFSTSLEEFDTKQKALKAAENKEKLRRLDNELAIGRTTLATNPSEDQSEFNNDKEPDLVKRGESLFDLLAKEKLKPFLGTPLEADAKRITETNRKPFVNRLNVDAHNTKVVSITTGLRSSANSLADAVIAAPSMLIPFLTKGETTLDDLGEIEAWTPETLRSEKSAYRKDFVTRVLTGLIGNGEALFVRDQLRQGQFGAFLDRDAISSLLTLAEDQFSQEMTAFEVEAGAHFKLIEATGVGDLRVMSEAASNLPDGEFDDFRRGEQRARTVHDFILRHRNLPDTEIQDSVTSLRPADSSNEETQKTFNLVQGAAQRLIDERRKDGAAAADIHPAVIAAQARGEEERAVSLRKAVQKSWGFPPETIRALSRSEARKKAAELDELPPAARAANVQSMKGTFGANFESAFSEISAEGLDPETVAIATIIDNPKAIQTFLQTAGVPFEKLAEGISPEVLNGLSSNVISEREEASQRGQIDSNISSYILEKSALKIFKETGDTTLAAKRAVGIFATRDVAETDIGAQDVDLSPPEIPANAKPGGTNSDLSPPSETEEQEILKTKDRIEKRVEFFSAMPAEDRARRKRKIQRNLRALQFEFTKIEKTLEEDRNLNVATKQGEIDKKTERQVLAIAKEAFSGLSFATGVANTALNKDQASKSNDIARIAAQFALPFIIIGSGIEELRRGTNPSRIESAKNLKQFQVNTLLEIAQEFGLLNLDMHAIRIFEQGDRKGF